MDFTCANVLEYLPGLAGNRTQLKAEGGPFDLIILDPPAFTKTRDKVRSAMRGYKEINAATMKLLPRGGYLATCSCSHFMTRDLFGVFPRATTLISSFSRWFKNLQSILQRTFYEIYSIL